jgi:hypothetical protein
MTLAAQAWELAFGNMSVEDGLALREVGETRYFPSADRTRFSKLLSIADLDAFLQTEAAQTGRVSMADGSRPDTAALPEDEYALESGAIDLPQLFQRFDSGASLVVSQFHELHAPLTRFCRGLERIFLHAAQANIYLTPPGAQGFNVHFDTHDVLVLQVEGEKRWHIWEHQPTPFPTRRTRWGGKKEPPPVGEPQLIVMKPGDVLYVPRGVLHEAIAQDGKEASLHITVGLLEPTWVDILQAAIEAGEPSLVGLRQPFPTWRLTEPHVMDKLVADAAERLKALGDRSLIEMASLRMLDRLATERMVMPARGLLTPLPGPNDRLQLADSVHQHVLPRPSGGGELRWAAGIEPLSDQEMDWLAALEAGATPASLGGGEAALKFCQHLASVGLLERVVTPPVQRAAE